MPTTLLARLRTSGFVLRDGAKECSVSTRDEKPHHLLVLRKTLDGDWEAKAAGNSPVGRSAAYREESPKVRSRVDKGLAKLVPETPSAFADAGPYVTLLKDAAGSLRTAASKPPPPPPPRPPRRGSSRWIQVVSGGLPSLGKGGK